MMLGNSNIRRVAHRFPFIVPKTFAEYIICELMLVNIRWSEKKLNENFDYIHRNPSQRLGLEQLVALRNERDWLDLDRCFRDARGKPVETATSKTAPLKGTRVRHPVLLLRFRFSAMRNSSNLVVTRLGQRSSWAEG